MSSNWIPQQGNTRQFHLRCRLHEVRKRSLGVTTHWLENLRNEADLFDGAAILQLYVPPFREENSNQYTI